MKIKKGGVKMEILKGVGNWTFENDEVVKNFDIHVVKSVPLYEMFHEMIIEFSKYFVMDNTCVVDVGTSTAHLLNKIKANNSIKKVKYIGIDSSKEMLQCSTKTYPHLTFLNKDLTDSSCYDEIENVSFISSMLCLQFISPNYKEFVLKNLHQKMNKGGAFVMVEKVKSTNIDLHDIYNNKYWEFKRKNGISDTDIINKNFSLEGRMFPTTVEKNIQLLNITGFETVEIFMKYNNFVGIIAIK